jgi:hypothetical protein
MRTIAGTLSKPNGDPIAAAVLRFVAMSTSEAGVPQGAMIDEATGDTGAYSVALVNGVYRISLTIGTETHTLGQGVVTNGAPVDLWTLLSIPGVPVSIAQQLLDRVIELEQVPPGSGIAGVDNFPGDDTIEIDATTNPLRPRLRATVEGLQGPPGPTGATGATGAQGPAGSTGATGAAGPQGETGPQGPAGPTGPQGPAGPAGTDGEDGATGPQGPQGDEGPPGADGAQGPQGVAGPAGADGATGPEGEQGPQGIQGEPGATGPQGIQGETGPQGEPGTDGADGAPGTDAVWTEITQAAYDALTPPDDDVLYVVVG